MTTFRRNIALLVLVVAGVIGSASSANAVVRGARQTGYFEFSVGGSSPIHEYDRLGSFPFFSQNDRPVFLAASDVYDPTFQLGLAFGQLVRDQYTLGVSFRYTNVRIDDYALDQIEDNGYSRDYRYNLYEIGADLNLYLLPHSKASLAPYVGAGLSVGAFSESAPGEDANAELVGDLHLNFGADLAVINEASTGGRMTLSSINSVSIGSLNDRPRYLTIGVGIRYFLPR